jgi:hypothetical protein
VTLVCDLPILKVGGEYELSVLSKHFVISEGFLIFAARCFGGLTALAVVPFIIRVFDFIIRWPLRFSTATWRKVYPFILD